MKKDRKHTQEFTAWRKEGVDRFNQPAWDGPHQGYCRWEDNQRLFYTEDGKERRSQSLVYLSEDFLDIGDFVVLGHHSDDKPVSGAVEVQRPRRIPNLRGTKFEYRYYV